MLTKQLPGTCFEIQCYHGAVCKELTYHRVQCVCQDDCEESKYSSDESTMLCGTDGNTYPSKCKLSLYSCRMQKNISILHESECTHAIFSNPKFNLDTILDGTVTPGPLRRSTNFKNLHQEHDKFTRDINELLLKSESTQPMLNTPSSEDNYIIKVPSFFGHSLIELPQIFAYSRLSIEIEFISFTENGVILYNGQTLSGDGDFVSISIKGG